MSGTEVVRHSAGPEAALWIASAVVHPRPGRGDLGEGTQRTIRGQVYEAPTGGQHPTIVAPHRRDGPYGAGHTVLANQVKTARVGDPTVVDPSGQDVHPQQLTVTSVPAKPFTEEGLTDRAGYRLARHATIRLPTPAEGSCERRS